MLMLVRDASAVTMGQTEHWQDGCGASQEKLQLQSQACGGGVLSWFWYCSSSRWIESAVVGKKGSIPAGNCDEQR